MSSNKTLAKGVSRRVVTNQTGPHERLRDIVTRHKLSENKRPIKASSLNVFEDIAAAVQNAGGRYILDACCGVGDSSRRLAAINPDTLVVGIDKSAHRLAREREEKTPANLLLVRADLNDLFRLLANAKLTPVRHYLLYPNPWPKAAHIQRRWHGAPVFPDLIRLGGLFETRSNWPLYLEECLIALDLFGIKATLAPFEPESYLTPFERKYHESGQQLWQLTANFNMAIAAH